MKIPYTKTKTKLKPRKKQSIARSRRACLGCRTKKLKCDETKPSCSRCVEKGLSCNYTLQLQFREDVEAKGKDLVGKVLILLVILIN